MIAPAAIQTLLERVKSWARSRGDVRAVVLLGSYARKEQPADRYADLDLLLIVTDAERLVGDPGWVAELDRPLLTFVEKTATGDGLERRVLFANGIGVDFSILPVKEALRLAEEGPTESLAAVISNGIEFLLDRDGLEAKIPRHDRPAPREPPSPERFAETVADYWYHALWAHRKLARGELWVAMGCSDNYMKRILLRLIEWNAHARHGPTLNTWWDGRFLENWADVDVLAALESTFATYSFESVGTALMACSELFARLAREIADRLGYSYPAEIEDGVQALIDNVRASKSARSEIPSE